MPRRATVRWVPRICGRGTKPGGGPARAADRLSALPDALLHHVMSFLKAWEAVRTCVLARLWRDSWASAPCLDLRVPCSRRDGDPPEEFGRFVCRMLLARDAAAPVDTLRLRSSDEDDYAGTYDNDDAKLWIRFSIKHNARVVHLNGHRKDDLVSEHMAFVSCHLKILKLSYVDLDGKVLKQLSVHCPSLEDLDLNSCSVKGCEVLSSSLKNLSMVKCQITVDFSVKAPNLLILRCITPYYRVSLFKNLGSLVSASITVDDSFLRDDEYLHVDEEFLETSEDNADDGENRFVHAEGKNTVSESDHDDYSFDDDDLLDEFYDRHASNLVDNYDYGTDIDSDDNTYEYSEIAADYRVGQHDHRHDSRKQGGNCDEDSTNCTRTDDKAFSGQNVLHSLSNATSLELLAHSGENYGNKEAVKVGVKPKGRSFTCKHLATVKIRCSKDDVRVHKLAEFFNANGIPLENIYVHLSGSTYLHSMKEMREICRDELQESGDWWR